MNNEPQLFINFFDTLVVGMNQILYVGETQHVFGDTGKCDFSCGTAAGTALLPLLPADTVGGAILVGSSSLTVGAGASSLICTATLTSSLPSLTIIGNVHLDDGITTSTPAFLWTYAGGMTYLPFPWGEDNVSTGYARGISSDGTKIAGDADYNPTTGYPRGIYWTNSGVTAQDIGTLGGTSTYVSALSSDGGTVVGSSDTGSTSHAMYWSVSGGMVDINDLGGPSSADAVSSDGSVIAGYTFVGAVQHAFRWTSGGGMVDLGTYYVGGHTYITGMSADGSILVGYGQNPAVLTETTAFYWTSGTGMVGITMPLGATAMTARAVSSDGTTIVGGYNDTDTHAYRWTVGDGVVGLSGDPSQALAISADGTTYVGTATNVDAENLAFPFYWTSDLGKVFLTALNVVSGTALGVLTI